MPIEHVQTKREIAALLEAAGLRPRKRFGQHFLIDGNLMRRLVQSAELGPGDLVLEVGAGTGGLTDLIVRRVRRLVAVEIDRDLHRVLEDRFGETEGIVLIRGDVLESKHRLHKRLVQVLEPFRVWRSDLGSRSPGAYTAGTRVRTAADSTKPGSAPNEESSGDTGRRNGCVKLVSNLPYKTATPLLMNLLVDYPGVRRLCFTVQSEVGERITAGPNRKAYGPLGIVARLLCSVQTVARIPPAAFWPRPAVDSVMLRMDVGAAPFDNRDQLRRFVALVRSTFEHRRKTLGAALKYVIPAESLAHVCKQFDVRRRPESLDIDEWVRLHGVVEEEAPRRLM